MKAKLGQNFLVSATAPQAIVAAAGDIRQRVVVEIGPGRGAITQPLAHAARRVVAIEYDRELAKQLASRYAATGDRVEIIPNDILRVDLTALSQREGERLVILGNLPYYITSEILLHLVAHAPALDRAVLMMQREVADRVCAQPGTRDYGLLTVTLQLYAEMERVLELTPADFAPAPKVHSAVVRLRFNPRYEALGAAPSAFQVFLKQCFAQKRKTLANNLRAASFPGPVLAAAWDSTGLRAECRAETLSLDQLASLFRELASAGGRLPEE